MSNWETVATTKKSPDEGWENVKQNINTQSYSDPGADYLPPEKPEQSTSDKIVSGIKSGVSGAFKDVNFNLPTSLKEGANQAWEAIKRTPQAVTGALETIGATFGSLTNMDIKAMETLGVISKERSEKWQGMISQVTNPQTPEGKFYTQFAGALFDMTPKAAEHVAKNFGLSDEAAHNIHELVTAAELAAPLIKRKPQEATPEGTPPATAPPTSTAPLEGEVIRSTSEKPKLETQPKPPIEGEVISPELTGQQKQLSAPQEKLPAPEVKETPTPTSPIVDIAKAKAEAEQARAESRMEKGDGYIAEWIDPKDIEQVTLEGSVEDQMKAQQVTNAKILQFVPKNQQGAIHPEVFAEGFRKIRDAILDSETLKSMRRFTEPLQAVPPEVAAAIKENANWERDLRFEQQSKHKWLDNIPKEMREQMGLSVERPELQQKLTPEQLGFVKQTVSENEALAETALHMGIIRNIKKPYFPHLVKQFLVDSADAKSFRGGGYLKTGVRSAIGRKYEGDILEAEAQSGMERIKDIKALVDINTDLKRAIRNRNFITNLREMLNDPEDPGIGLPGQKIRNGVPLHDIPGMTDRKFVTTRNITVDGIKYPVKNGTVRIGNEEYMADMERGKVAIGQKVYDITSYSKVESNPIYVKPEYKSALDAAFKAEEINPLIKLPLVLKGISLRAIMLWPQFHHMTVFTKAVPTMPGAGFSPKVWGHPEALYGKEIMDSAGPAAKAAMHTWFGFYMAGHYIRGNEMWMREALRDNVVLPGEKGYQVDLYGVERGDTMTWKQEVGNKILPGLGDKIEAVNKFLEYDLLWKQVGNLQLGIWKMQKLKLTEEGITSFKKRTGRDPSPEEIGEIAAGAGKTAGHLSNLIGGMFGKEDFAPGWRNFLNLTLFSRSNMLSMVRLTKYGFGVMPKFLEGQLEALKMDDLGKSAARSAALGAGTWTIVKDLFLAYAVLQAGNYLTTWALNIPDKNGNLGGHFAWDNEKDREKYIAVGKQPDGKTVTYMNLPFRTTRDMMNMLTNPEVLLKDKPSTLVQFAKEVATQKDWRGRDIEIPGDNWGQHAMQWTSEATKIFTGYEQTLGTINPDDAHSYNKYRLLGLQFASGAKGGPVVGALESIKREQDASDQLIMDQAAKLANNNKTDDAIKLLIDNNLVEKIPNYLLKTTNPEAAALLRLRIADIYKHATPEQRERLDNLKFGDK